MKPSAVFLDRDGVVNEDLPTGVTRWEEFSFVRGALEAIARLARSGVPTFIITNQANVGRGVVARATVEGIHEQMLERVRQAGGAIAGIYACFHGPGDGCECRKPAPGLLLAAAAENGLDLARTVLVGDDARDLEAARRAGVPAVLVRTGKGRSVEPRVASGELRAEVFDDLLAFTRSIVPDR